MGLNICKKKKKKQIPTSDAHLVKGHVCKIISKISKIIKTKITPNCFDELKWTKMVEREREWENRTTNEQVDWS